MEPDERMKECIFVSGRSCPVGLDEVPLDICRLCLEAWRANRENITVKPLKKRLEVAVEGSGASETVKVKPPTTSESVVPARSQLSLSELDKLFWEGKIEMGQYLQRRKEIVNSLSREDSPFSSFERALEKLEVDSVDESGVVFVVEGGRVKARHPEGAVLPEGFEGSGEALKAVQELFGALNRHRIDVHIEVGWKRITCLGCKAKRLALLVLDSKAKLENFEEGITEARNMLSQSENWEEILPLLHNVIVGRARPAVEEL
jgi:hypothetical protein